MLADLFANVASFGVDPHVVVTLGSIAFVAAVVTGAVGYGFSSVTVPVGLMVTTQRVLNPALVAVELVVNVGTVVVNRRGLRAAWTETRDIIVGLAVGIGFGAAALGVVSALPLKTATYAILLPLVLVQLLASRRSVQAGPAPSHATGVSFGVGLGALYALTTLSGPPLALFFARRGLTHDAFRAALALVRVVEAALAAVAYAALGLFTPSALVLGLAMAPAVLVGLPLGRALAQRVPARLFARLVLGLDVVFISVGLFTSLWALFGPFQPIAVAVGGGVAVLVIATVVVVVRAVAGGLWRRGSAPSGELQLPSLQSPITPCGPLGPLGPLP
jgi:uncharacterized membrane protein YfcA